MSSKPDSIPLLAVRRLSLYLRQLEALARDGRATISSRELGKALGLTDAQVRKDLAYFGQFGHPGIGYRVDEVIQRVKRILGTDRTWNTALIGAGNLGQALLAYRGFERKGFRLVAIFDSDRAKVGSRPDRIENVAVQHISDLPRTVARLKVMLAMIAVPAAAAQAVADQLVSAGVRGILNFAPVALAVPDSVAVSSVDLAVRLEQLSFQVNSMGEPPLRPAADGHK